MRSAFTTVLILCVLVQPMELAAEPPDGTSAVPLIRTKSPRNANMSVRSPSLGKLGLTASQPQMEADIWDRLPSLPNGTRVRLMLTDGSEVIGHLVSASTDAAVLDKSKVRKGPFTAPTGMSLRDPLTFRRSEVLSVAEAKGWPVWAKVLLWVGMAWVVAGAIVGSIVGNS